METLIKRLIDKDDEAWKIFVYKFQRVIKATIDKFHQLDVLEKEDLYQDVFRALIENDYKILKSFKNNTETAMGLYLKRVAYSLCLKKIKSKNKSLFLPEDELEQINSEYKPDENVYDKIVKEEIKQVILGMPIIYRDILILTLKGFGIIEISEELGLKERTVETRLYRARKILSKNNKLKSFIT